MLSKKFILGLFMFFSTIASAQKINISEYCRDMAMAQQRGNSDYYKQCVATLEVQRKYENQAISNARRNAQSNAEVDALIKRNDISANLDILMNEAEDAKSSDEKSLILKKIGLILENCHENFREDECADFRNNSQRVLLKGFKRDIPRVIPKFSLTK